MGDPHYGLRDAFEKMRIMDREQEKGLTMNISKHAQRTSIAAIAAVCAALACCLLLACGCSQSSSGAASSSGSASASNAASAASAGSAALKKAEASGPYASGIHHATLTVEGYDPITIELDADAAPASVANFCALVSDGYYNGLTFYRFAEGFCMQGGTKGNSASGNDSSLEAVVGEFSANGYDNPMADDFKKGTVAMARSSDPNSARSTFFVTLDSSPMVAQSLNGLYAAFGTIDDAGMKTVDKIVEDYLPNVTDPQMGAIDDESKQAKIASITIDD